jgi:hypothetical protein
VRDYPGIRDIKKAAAMQSLFSHATRRPQGTAQQNRTPKYPTNP